MMAHIAAMSILPSLMPKLPYDPQRDFAPISLVAIGPNLLVVHPSLPAKTVKELIALAPTGVDVPALLAPPVDLAAYDTLLVEVAA